MKVLSIVSSGYEQGGVETTVASYNKLFRKRGIDSRILSSNVRPDVPHYSDYEFEAISDRGLKKIFNEPFNVDAYRVTRKVLNDFHPDVVILHTMQQTTPLILLCLKKYPTIQCVHGPEAFTASLLPWHINRSNFKHKNYDLKDLTFKGRFKYLCLKYPYGYFYKFCFKNVDRFLVFSSYTRQLLRTDGYKKTTSYIPSGVKLFKYYKNYSNNSYVIGYAGRLEKFKGVIDLLDAMPLILKSQPKVSLIIAGEGSYSDEIIKRTQELGIGNRVTYKGRLDREEMAKFYNEISVLVMPSLWPETFGKVGVEAMSVGTPVVATDVGGVRDWLEDTKNGFLVSPSKPDQIAEKVLNILKDSNIQNMMKICARETAEKFSMEKFADNLLEIIQETVEQA
jgi:glycosyltransferase involved in cell wall biosynthesis